MWSADFGLAEDSTAAVPLYTLSNRQVVKGAGEKSNAWAWEYQGRYQDGASSPWLTGDETRDSFSPLQLDVFHALWELYNPDVALRPPGAPTRGEREVVARAEALRQYPLKTDVGREFADREGNFKIFRAEVCDFCDPYWRVEYDDGDWEELTRTELDRGKALATRFTTTSNKGPTRDPRYGRPTAGSLPWPEAGGVYRQWTYFPGKH